MPSFFFLGKLTTFPDVLSNHIFYAWINRIFFNKINKPHSLRERTKADPLSQANTFRDTNIDSESDSSASR